MLVLNMFELMSVNFILFMRVKGNEIFVNYLYLLFDNEYNKLIRQRMRIAL